MDNKIESVYFDRFNQAMTEEGYPASGSARPTLKKLVQITYPTIADLVKENDPTFLLDIAKMLVPFAANPAYRSYHAMHGPAYIDKLKAGYISARISQYTEDHGSKYGIAAISVKDCLTRLFPNYDDIEIGDKADRFFSVRSNMLYSQWKNLSDFVLDNATFTGILRVDFNSPSGSDPHVQS